MKTAVPMIGTSALDFSIMMNSNGLAEMLVIGMYVSGHRTADWRPLITLSDVHSGEFQ